MPALCDPVGLRGERVERPLWALLARMVVLQCVFDGFHWKHASRVGERPILSLGAHQALPTSLSEAQRGLTQEAEIGLSSR